MALMGGHSPDCAALHPGLFSRPPSGAPAVRPTAFGEAGRGLWSPTLATEKTRKDGAPILYGRIKGGPPAYSPGRWDRPDQRRDHIVGSVRSKKNDFTGKNRATTISKKIEIVSNKDRQKIHGVVAGFFPMASKIKSDAAPTSNRECTMSGNMPIGIAKQATRMNITNQVQRTLFRYPVHVTMRPMITSASVSLPTSLTECAYALSMPCSLSMPQ